jgi:hypothetical protein
MIELKSTTITLHTKSGLFASFLPEFNLSTETIRTFQVGQHFLNRAPMCT